VVVRVVSLARVGGGWRTVLAIDPSFLAGEVALGSEASVAPPPT
jgi:hypothetical protein